MTESILVSIKKLLGIAEEYDAFDADIIMHINSVFTILRQIGVGPSFTVEDDTTTWEEYLSESSAMEQFASIKSFIYLKVRMLFDPPTNGTLVGAINEQLKELEYRLYAEAHWPTT